MLSGGLKVGIVGNDKLQMIAIAQNLSETLEIRKFARNMEEVLSVTIEKDHFAGNHITWQEAQAAQLTMPGDP